MSTKNQLIKTLRIIKTKKNKTPRLSHCPQKKGVCERVFVTTPKKPNSALRKVAKIWIPSNKTKAICYIPGIGHNLQKFSTILIRGGRVKDIPGMRYRVIRGKYDTKGVLSRRTAWSKYGVKNLFLQKKKKKWTEIRK